MDEPTANQQARIGRDRALRYIDINQDEIHEVLPETLMVVDKGGGTMKLKDVSPHILKEISDKYKIDYKDLCTASGHLVDMELVKKFRPRKCTQVRGESDYT